METLRKITLKVDITRDESGDVLLNGFGPKSQMGRAYLMVLHGALEEAVHEAERLEWCANRAKAKADAIHNLIARS